MCHVKVFIQIFTWFPPLINFQYIQLSYLKARSPLDSIPCIFCQMRQTIGLFIAFTATGINVNGEFMTRNGTFVDRNINYKPSGLLQVILAFYGEIRQDICHSIDNCYCLSIETFIFLLFIKLPLQYVKLCTLKMCMTEINFWEAKCINLESLYEQMQSNTTVKMASILYLTDSAYYPAFKSMYRNVVAAMREAQDLYTNTCFSSLHSNLPCIPNLN